MSLANTCEDSGALNYSRDCGKQFDLRVINALLENVRTKLNLRNFYVRLFRYLLLYLFYVLVMLIQVSEHDSYQVTSSIAAAAVPPKYSVQFLDWLKTMILEVWTDPICGNGSCEEPYEFPSFGRFGCEADCGRAEFTPFLIYFEVDFHKFGSSIVRYDIADELRKRATWNLCMRDADRDARSMPEICWYEQDESFKSIQQRFVVEVALKQGDWYIRILNDELKIVQGRVYQVMHSASDDLLRSIQTSPKWDARLANDVWQSPPTPSPPLPMMSPSTANPPSPPNPITQAPSSVTSVSPTMMVDTLHPSSSSPTVANRSTAPLTAPASWKVKPGHIAAHAEAAQSPELRFAQDDWESCRAMCEAVPECGGFSYHGNYSWCLFKGCSSLENVTWLEQPGYDFHYIQRADCRSHQSAAAPSKAGERRRLACAPLVMETLSTPQGLGASKLHLRELLLPHSMCWLPATRPMPTPEGLRSLLSHDGTVSPTSTASPTPAPVSPPSLNGTQAFLVQTGLCTDTPGCSVITSQTDCTAAATELGYSKAASVDCNADYCLTNNRPTLSPSLGPTSTPTATATPTTGSPTLSPSREPTYAPTATTSSPSRGPTSTPTGLVSIQAFLVQTGLCTDTPGCSVITSQTDCTAAATELGYSNAASVTAQLAKKVTLTFAE
ncbi:hypothetical protein CYMTET_28975 [Cymbomonas tetramitiformis]|uniref:Uncharacterized protein n=1 Tax=Cymbomonas tetramitiformis TaxID=36881 RepID=A0AAE0KVD3_9CHLO|nr:hypothetical protein CYMTET_28975 [Cymbomonas tetramitiformis]